MKRLAVRFDNSGFALVEILVALGIGLVVVGAVLSSYVCNRLQRRWTRTRRSACAS
jgi:prepilin-type N-terminal cleavage/methylation domain-containing protein